MHSDVQNRRYAGGIPGWMDLEVESTHESLCSTPWESRRRHRAADGVMAISNQSISCACSLKFAMPPDTGLVVQCFRKSA
jgi:hypothetical protein